MVISHIIWEFLDAVIPAYLREPEQRILFELFISFCVLAEYAQIVDLKLHWKRRDKGRH